VGSITMFHGGRRANFAVAARNVAARAFANAELLDEDAGFPSEDVAALHETGLLAAPLPVKSGGGGLSGIELAAVLRHIGGGSLPLGRLYEGHVNAIGLVLQYGRPNQIRRTSREVCDGKLFGVWNTDDSSGLLVNCQDGVYRLKGRKILASGASHIERPIVTATDGEGGRRMVMPRVAGDRADLSQWTAHGMRASASGAVDFTGIVVDDDDILGSEGDYERQPLFSGGAWRFAAVQVGGMERLLDLLRSHLRRTGRGSDSHQAARLGQAAISVETARLWMERASVIAEDVAQEGSSEAIVAYVNFARLAVERAGLDLLELIHRSVGLQSFMRPGPIERISRDLATYLRQPGPDRALTSAASYVLELEMSASDLWR
jgi:alkylation response protein AidB-like acyl-CoA dehydrogenase